MTPLIERIEAASEADRLLDAAMAVHLRLGLPAHASWALKFPDWAVGRGGQVHILNGAHGTAGHFYAPRYTASMDAALTLVPDGHQWDAGTCGEDNMPWACVTLHDFDKGCPDFTGAAATPALALCIAALRAREGIATDSPVG